MIKLLLWLLQRRTIASSDRALILNYFLKEINALPVTDIVSFDALGKLRINGKELTVEQAISLKESAVSLQNNQAYRLIKDQITYEALKLGIHTSITLEMVLMSKAALFIQQQEALLISKLSQE